MKIMFPKALKRMKPKEQTDRRRHPRLTLPLLFFTDEGHGYREQLQDISREGCRISTPQQYQKGDHVLLHFETAEEQSESDRSFCLHGCVMWSAPIGSRQYAYGMHFTADSSVFFKQEMMHFHQILDREQPLTDASSAKEG
jgi:Tfp pilus assembly protein PilZ